MLTRAARGAGALRAFARPRATRVLAAAIAIGAAACELGEADRESPKFGGASIDVIEVEPAVEPGDPARSALAYARARRARLGLGEEDVLAVASIARGPGAMRYVRLTQRRGDRRVWGAELVVRVRGGDVVGMSGEIAPGLELARGKTPLFDRGAALAVASSGLAARGEARDVFDRERAELVVFPRAGEPAALAWAIERFAEARGEKGPSRPRQLVDAESGEELGFYDAIAEAKKASGPGGNPRAPRRWEESLEVTRGCDAYVLASPRLETVDMRGRSTGSGRPVRGGLSCVPNRAANDAHGFAAITLDMFAEWMSRESIDDDGAVIRSRVNYSRDYANAFWDGESVSYGDGGESLYPLSGDLGVVAHEIAHGFTEHHADLAFEGEAGALNESFSDVAGAATAYYADGAHATEPALAIGGDVARDGEGPLRDLCDPTRDGRSIEHADEYEDGMYLHAASGVPNRAFCLSARALSGGGEATRGGVRRAARAWFEANAGFWTPRTGFRGGCRGVLGAAAELGFEPNEVEAIAGAWAEVGVECAPP